MGRPGAVTAAAVLGYIHAVFGLYFTASEALFQYPREIAGTSMFQLTMLAQFIGMVLLVVGSALLRSRTRVVYALATVVGMPAVAILYMVQDVAIGLSALLLLVLLPLTGLLLTTTTRARYWFSGGR